MIMPGWHGRFRSFLGRRLMRHRLTPETKVIALRQQLDEGGSHLELRRGRPVAPLDGVDQFEHWKGRRPSAIPDMIDLVSRIASYARAKHKDFLIVPQNGDELLHNARLLPLID